MKSAMEVGTKIKSAMELATEVEEANEMKTVMEVPTEWTSEEELWWNNNWIDLQGSWNDMCDGSSNSSEVHSEWELSMIQQQPKWNLHWEAGVVN